MTTQARQGRGTGQAPVIDIYARISRKPRDPGSRKVEDQVADGIADITSRGAHVGKVHRDEAKSAWSPKVLRPEWDALMDRLRSGDADGVWVWEVTRFSRKMREGEDLLDIAKDGLIVWSDDQEHNLNKAAGRRAFREAMVAAVAESETISERTARGLMKKAMRGRSTASHRGFAMPGYAPKPDGWEPGDPREMVSDEQIEREREAVREVARRVMRGDSWASMVRWLNQEGHVTYTGRAWRAEELSKSLRRPALAGIAEHNGEHLGTLPGEPVLDRKTWDLLQSAMAARKPGRRPSSTYLLTGILICGRCGKSMNGRPAHDSTPYPDGEMARVYFCQPRNGTGCGRNFVDQRFADQVVTTMCLDILSDPEHADAQARTSQAVAEAHAEVTAERSRLDADLDALADKVAAWGVERVDRAMGPLLAAREALDAREAALDAPTGPAVAPWAAADEWAAADTLGRRALLRQAFPRGVVVDPAASRGVGARHDRGRFRVAE